jgi:hypothetical protein
MLASNSLFLLELKICPVRIMVRQSMCLNIHRDTCTDNVNVGSYKDEVYLRTFLNRDSAIIVEGIIYSTM